MEVIEEIQYGSFTIKIIPDEDAYSPRENDNLGTMVCWHRRYDLGDRKPTDQEMEALRRGGWALLERYLRRWYGMRHLLKLGLLDHSGLHIYAGGGDHWSDPGGWDSGTVGWIMALPEGIEMTGVPDEEIEVEMEVGYVRGKVTGKQNAILHGLHGEVKEYDQYLTGDVYGYVIEGPQGENIDSCWGFYGQDYCEAEARAAVDAYCQDRATLGAT